MIVEEIEKQKLENREDTFKANLRVLLDWVLESG
jgi:hypothetical protein